MVVMSYYDDDDMERWTFTWLDGDGAHSANYAGFMAAAKRGDLEPAISVDPVTGEVTWYDDAVIRVHHRRPDADDDPPSDADLWDGGDAILGEN